MLTRVIFSLVVVLQMLVRVAELRHSRRNQRALAQRGAGVEPEPAFAGMFALHTGVFAGALTEVWTARRPFVPWLAAAMLMLVLASNGLRWWVIATLRGHWNVRVVRSVERLGVVTAGPYRWIRHPNYVAVYIELLAIPLMHGAWLTAVAAAVLHVPVLHARLRVEERALESSEEYVRTMAWKPRFLPSFTRRPPGNPPAPQGHPG